jgi:hypothetical protein
MDAFSSDSIPVHLITREAIDLYFRKLDNEGLLLIHISNRYVDLEPVLGALAQDARLTGRIQTFSPAKIDPTAELKIKTAATREYLVKFRYPSVWVLLAENDKALGNIATDHRWRPLQSEPEVGLWSDDYSNIIKVLRWGTMVTSD